jgi:hypothetical protein
MTVEEFIELKRKELQIFADEWNERSYENPDQYPISLSEGEWEEQLNFHFE